MIIEFYWGRDAEERFRIEIHNRGKCFTEEDIEQLLDEYRKEDEEEYNRDGWVDFLEKKGYTVRDLEAETCIYF